MSLSLSSSPGRKWQSPNLRTFRNSTGKKMEAKKEKWYHHTYGKFIGFDLQFLILTMKTPTSDDGPSKNRLFVNKDDANPDHQRFFLDELIYL
jgi:hypothetical protein